MVEQLPILRHRDPTKCNGAGDHLALAMVWMSPEFGYQVGRYRWHWRIPSCRPRSARAKCSGMANKTPKPKDSDVFLDLECQLSAQEVGGFSAEFVRRRKLAVAVVYEEKSGLFTAYQEKDAAKLVRHLAAARRVIGYNLVRFDLEILRAYDPKGVDGIRAFDLFQELWDQTGHRWSLDNLAEATLGSAPAPDGNLVTAKFQRGDVAGCVEDCREDVRRIAALYRFGADNGFVYGRKEEGARRRRIKVTW